MKHLLSNIIFLVLFIHSGFAITPKQVIIPMLGSNAMSFYKDSYNDYNVDGFAIDSLGRFYFCGGEDIKYISCFQDGKFIFSEKIGSSIVGPTLLKDQRLYIFTGYITDDVLKSYKIDSSFIHLEKTKNIISAKKINCVFFTDSNFVIETLETFKDDEGVHSKGKYSLFDLSGQYKQDTYSLYNLPQSVFKNEELGTFQYIGMYKENYVFYYIKDHNSCLISLRNASGETIMSQEISMQLLGTSLMSSQGGGPEEHKKIVDEKLYILGHKKENLIISIFPLKDLFNNI